MKKILFFIVALFLILTPDDIFAVPGSPPTGWINDGSGNPYTTGTVVVGTVNTTEGTEVTVMSVTIENDADAAVIAWSKTVEFVDETDGTEDVVVREYTLVGGTLGMSYSTKLYAAIPSGSELPVLGCKVLADRANWDPAAIASGGAYWVWWDGNSWELIDAQAD